MHKLASLFVRPQDVLAEIYYFTALATWNQAKVDRHQLFIRAQENDSVRTIYGEFRKTTKKCRECGKTFPTFEGKETDVNIA